MTESFKKKAGFSRCSSQSPYPKEFGALRIVRVNAAYGENKQHPVYASRHFLASARHFETSRRLRKLLELAVVGVGA